MGAARRLPVEESVTSVAIAGTKADVQASLCEKAGLIVSSIAELEELNSEWRQWLQDMEP